MATNDHAADEGLSRYAPHLDPDNVQVKPPRWEIWAIVLIVATISALITAGIFQARGHKLTVETAPEESDELELVGVSQQLAVIVVEGDARREIKLLDTQSLRVQDITRGQTAAVTAALSPDGHYLAYLYDSPDGIEVSVAKVAGGDPLSLAASALLKAGEDTDFNRLEVCKWTNIAWSTDSSRFLMFGCDKGNSVIVVVSVDKILTPKLIPRTRGQPAIPREAMWLNSEEILFSESDDATGKTGLKKVSVDDEGSPVLIYGQ